MFKNTNKGDGKLWLLFIVLLPFLFFGLLFLYTKQARTDLSTLRYPDKMYPIGIDTITYGTNKVIDTIYHELSDFNGKDQYNVVTNKSRFLNKIIVINFISKNCPEICSMVNSQLQEIQNDFIRDDQIIILTFVVDVPNDTTASLKQMANHENAIPGKWFFVNGIQQEILNFANQSCKLNVTFTEQQELQNHENVLVVDPDWNIRGFYNGTLKEDINLLKGDLVLLLEEFKR